MSNCPTNTTLNDPSQYDINDSALLQGVMNRLKSYWDKYNVSGLYFPGGSGNPAQDRRISVAQARYAGDTSTVQHTISLTNLLNSLKSYLNAYKDKYDGSGGDFSWTAVAQYDKEQVVSADELRNNMISLESQCWACHSGFIISCSCNATCYNYYYTCLGTCYSVGCVCNAIYNHGCTCDQTTHDAGTQGGVAYCGCHNTCYQETCTCYGSCYDVSHCYQCYITCYGYNCSCNAACYGYLCSQCYGTTY